MVEKDESTRATKRRRGSRTDSNSGSSGLLAPPSTHEMYMKRASYQDIFKDVTGAADDGKGDKIQPSPLASAGQTGTEMLAAAAASHSASMNAAASKDPQSHPPPLVLPIHAQMQRGGGAPGMTQQQIRQMQALLQAAQHQQVVAAAMQAPYGMAAGAAIGYDFNKMGQPALDMNMNRNNNDMGDDNKKQTRLWKNRIAAKECRRKKKEYVKDLETRCKQLETQNDELQRQLAAAQAGLSPAQLAAVQAQMKQAGSGSSAQDKNSQSSKKK